MRLYCLIRNTNETCSLLPEFRKVTGDNSPVSALQASDFNVVLGRDKRMLINLEGTFISLV